MTFQPKKISPFRTDILEVRDSTSTSSGYNWLNISGSILKTNATLGTNEITLPAGSHWRLTFCGGQRYAGGSQTGAETAIQFWDTGAGQFVGLQGHCTGFSALTKGRSEACLLLRNADISTSITLRCFYKTPTSGNWQQTTSSYYDHLSLVIMELPA